MACPGLAFQEWTSQQGLNNTVLSGCAWVDVTAMDDGRRVTQFGNERLVLGYHRPGADLQSAASFTDALGRSVLEGFCELLRAGGANVEAAEDADIARWRKVLWCVRRSLHVETGYLTLRRAQECVILDSVHSDSCTCMRGAC